MRAGGGQDVHVGADAVRDVVAAREKRLVGGRVGAPPEERLVRLRPDHDVADGRVGAQEAPDVRAVRGALPSRARRSRAGAPADLEATIQSMKRVAMRRMDANAKELPLLNLGDLDEALGRVQPRF